MITNVQETGDRTSNQNIDSGTTEYTRSFMLTANSIVGLTTVQNDWRLPAVGDPYIIYAPDFTILDMDLTATLRTKTVTSVFPHYKVTCNYSNARTAGAQPTDPSGTTGDTSDSGSGEPDKGEKGDGKPSDRPISLSVGTEWVEEWAKFNYAEATEAEPDLGEPVQENSAGDMFEVPVKVKRPLPTYNITMSRETWHHSSKDLFEGKVNDSDFTILGKKYDPFTLYINQYQVDIAKDGSGGEYWVIKISMIYNDEGHYDNVLDCGYYYWLPVDDDPDNDLYLPSVDDIGNPKLVKLDGKGELLQTGLPPVFLKKLKYVPIDFNFGLVG